METAAGREAFDVPVSLAVGVTFAWIFACAWIFHAIEPTWDYFTSFYFVFVSLTTIGYGQGTLSHPFLRYMQYCVQATWCRRIRRTCSRPLDSSSSASPWYGWTPSSCPLC